MEANAIKTAQAGTLESMDCLVVVTGCGAGRVMEVSGGMVARFEVSMKKKINDTLDALGAHEPLRISVQDNGALDVVLGARVEAAYKRYARMAV
ncbi:MAG: citrate lyase acyl carrier protein [Synergistaceae bacterium]|nr:citrate lyase acyl carrier protein [Synergistaceae bacterium]